MQNRRNFLFVLWRCLVAFSLTPLLVRCGFAGEESDRSFTSELSSGHTHTLLVPSSVISAPSSAGWSGVTDEQSGHTHDVDLTGEQLQNISRRVRFEATSQTEDGHEHVFDFKI